MTHYKVIMEICHVIKFGQILGSLFIFTASCYSFNIKNLQICKIFYHNHIDQLFYIWIEEWVLHLLKRQCFIAWELFEIIMIIFQFCSTFHPFYWHIKMIVILLLGPVWFVLWNRNQNKFEWETKKNFNFCLVLYGIGIWIQSLFIF